MQKFYVFRFYVGKKILQQEMGRGAWHPHIPLFPYGPGYKQSWHHSNKNMQVEITHTENQQPIHNWNWTNFHVFLENNISHQNQTLPSEKLQTLLLLLRAQKPQDDSWF